jgi:hypothetical protein
MAIGVGMANSWQAAMMFLMRRTVAWQGEKLCGSASKH